MGLTLSTLWSLWRRKDVRIVMVGLDAAGKTTILNKLKLGENLMTMPTIGFNVDTVEYKNLKLTMWDVGGQTRLRSLWHHYFANSDAVIFVVDSNDRDRITEAANELHQVLAHEALANASLLVIANKQDLPNAVSTSDIQERLKLRNLGSNRKWFVQGASATTGNGLWAGLDWLAANLPPVLASSKAAVSA